MPETHNEVTAAGIARLAGVGRAAVSNWRRRYGDFPKPIGGTETSPTFALDEIEQWLRDQGKLTAVPLRERVWQQVEAHPAGIPAMLKVIGALLLAGKERPEVWSEPSPDQEAEWPSRLLREFDGVVHDRFGAHSAVRTPAPAEIDACSPVLKSAAQLAGELGVRGVYEFLLGRYLDANPRQYALTPAATAELMAELAGPASEVFDPACGTGALLRAAGGGTAQPGSVHAQDADADLAVLTALRLALHGDGPVRVHIGDSLRADALPRRTADVVLCHPPFNDRNWGHDELIYDARWEYGLPARTESELAWVQHALSHARDDGTVVLLMPPAAASRRSGRRIRADLLRRGVLRAVIALPPGAAPPYGIPLHLWVLRRPGKDHRPVPHLLLVDTAESTSVDGEKPSWQAVRGTVLEAWRVFDQDGTAPARPGVSRALPVIELLDDDVDLAPARHVPPAVASGGATELAEIRSRLAAELGRASVLPSARAALEDQARWPSTTVGALARAGALLLRSGGQGAAPSAAMAARPAVLTEHDVMAGTEPSGALPDGPAEDPVLIAVGDVIVPVFGRGRVARVITADSAAEGSALGRNLHLLRPDPTLLDSWFLAGFLRGTANNRRASSYTSTASRLDVRRLQLPRLPLADQQRYGEQFRVLAAFEEALRLSAQLGEQLVQGLYDGLADGTVRPQ